MLALSRPRRPLPPFPHKQKPTRCSTCGMKLVDLDKDRHPYRCANGDLTFRSPQLVAVAVVLFGRKVALALRGRDPKSQHWAAPGGFVEWGEDSRSTALNEFGQEFFGLPVDRELNVDLDMAYIGERPGTDEMSHLIVWGGRWPEDVPYELPPPVAFDANVPNQQRPEVLQADLFDIDELPTPLAYPYQVDFFRATLAHFWG